MFRNITEIKKANKDLGHYWFSPDTMRFFKSRISSKVYKGKYFIASKCFGYGHPRTYNIHIANQDGSIDTGANYQEFDTLSQAKTAIKGLI